MKKLVLLASFICSIAFISCSKNTVADIDGDKISLEEFNKFYYAQLKSRYNVKTNKEIDDLAANEDTRNPMLDKTLFLDQLVQHKLLLNLAKDSDIVDTKEVEQLLDMQEENLVVGFYSKSKLIDKISVSEEEIQKEYNKNIRKFGNAPINKIEAYLKKMIKAQKFQQKATELVDDMKLKSKIERNQIVLQELTSKDFSKRPKTGWVAKVNGDEINVQFFEDIYYNQLTQIYYTTKEEIDKIAKDPMSVKRNPLLDKKEFLDQLIRQKLVYAKAKEEGLLDNVDLKAMIQMQKEVFIIGHYIREKYKKELEPSEELINETYKKYKANYKGVPKDKAIIDVKSKITTANFNKKMDQLIQEQKEKVIIEKFTDLLKKEKNDDAKK